MTEFEARKHVENTNDDAFDDHELDEIVMSRMVVESLLTAAFYDKVFIRYYGQRPDFKDLPGSRLLMMVLETCNASVSHDIDSAQVKFREFTLDSYPGEDITEFATEAQR